MFDTARAASDESCWWEKGVDVAAGVVDESATTGSKGEAAAGRVAGTAEEFEFVFVFGADIAAAAGAAAAAEARVAGDTALPGAATTRGFALFELAFVFTSAAAAPAPTPALGAS